MIQFTRWKSGGKYIFAKGNWCENIYLWTRGYRRHQTSLGWCMAKPKVKEYNDNSKI